MADNKDDENPKPAPEEEEQDTGVELDEDLAAALAGASDGESDIDVDEALAELDPDFSAELEEISKQDFSGVVIEKDTVSSAVDDDEKVPSAFRSFVNNLPSDLKNRYKAAAAVVVMTALLALLIINGKILPSFELPFQRSMDEISSVVHTYPTDGPEVPLFDEYRTDAHTVELPKTVINLKSEGGNASYGEFQFSLVLRDKDLSTAIAVKESEIIDLIQRALEEETLRVLQTPVGKERVKKIIRHRINEYLQGNVVISVYYREVILEK